MARRPHRVLTPLKSASFEIRISSFVPPSKIVVWGIELACIPKASALKKGALSVYYGNLR